MYAVRMEKITKRFGQVVANDAVDFEVAPAEIHCLLGENGAGKSTLMRILFGLYQKDSGEIYINDESVAFSGPRDAIAHGIGMVHQHFMLAGRLTVTENIVAGDEPRKGLLLDYKKAREKVRDVSKRYGLKVDPDARVENISVGQQQRVEILKALMRNARVLILDEPTAVLTPQEVQDLFEVMRKLKEGGATIIFITHKLKETMAISDRVTVLRDGRKVTTVNTAEVSAADLAELMVGRQIVSQAGKGHGSKGKVVLELQNVSVRGPGGRARLEDVALQVRSGEILGIAGVEGNGQLELEEVILGLRPVSQGRILLNGEDITRLRPKAVRDKGIACIPSDRLKRGVIDSFTVAQNLVLGTQSSPPFSIRGILQARRINEHAERIVAKFDVRTASHEQPVSSLSGGNQQKLVVGRELTRRHDLIVASQPTRGLDVGATDYIHRQLLAMRDEGKAILLISAELDEIRSLSDRIAVMYEGRIVATGPADEFTEKDLGLLMAGHRIGVQDYESSPGSA
ncbi:MAG: ABC transporter ATP-binding protein [Bacillota bacterium]